jgi:hypothetical protein
MKKRVLLAGVCVVLGGLCMVYADTLFTHPFIVVSPKKVDFGVVRMKQFATNCFLVENVGSGTLVGTATVPPPFKILSGGSYKVPRNGAHVVTVIYTPDGSPTNVQTVTFTGGTSDVTATVTGKLSTKRWPYYLQRKK